MISRDNIKRKYPMLSREQINRIYVEAKRITSKGFVPKNEKDKFMLDLFKKKVTLEKKKIIIIK